MTAKRLFVFVEGIDDERFFLAVVLPVIQHRFLDIAVIRYAGMKREKLGNFLQSVQSMGAAYLFVADQDYHPCVTRRKDALITQYALLTPERIVIVKPEIEAWYLAGLDKHACRHIKVKEPKTTNTLTKEQFDALIPAHLTRLQFMLAILDIYSFDTGTSKNASFKYFAHKHMHP